MTEKDINVIKSLCWLESFYNSGKQNSRYYVQKLQTVHNQIVHYFNVSLLETNNSGVTLNNTFYSYSHLCQHIKDNAKYY